MFISEIILQTGDLAVLKKFYKEILQLDLIFENETSFKVQTQSTVITFLSANEIENPFYHFAFNIPRNKFKEAKEWIKERTELLELNGEDEFDFKSWNAHSVYFFDPAGNIVELIARNDLQNDFDGKFSGKNLLSVSEIGLVVNDVEDFYNTVNANFNIPVFSGDLKTFTAAGDNSGLFIIVPKGRNWFPVNIEAKIFPLKIKINAGVKRKFIAENLHYDIVSE